ncbi:MATE efflux family protein [Emticicia oligotrophica DSM 17448]|uniref:Multidrug-efflux transporter n=1 Tax=Emticicia oligotrophica (strain DSM 17448 / CIP 109782 / MTCC 6937 / GPTSA100-15) TaxID=929562 RepID=A0ABM5N0F7_EMTOG|nr:MATE family efflux transporter [Emticicia oligotrophica]AFK02893.1 MATE efflux family protein [Emticicia oligotrophica DSM 17448]
MSLFSQQYQQEIKKTFLLALPIVIAQLGVVLMGVTDNIMVGRYIGKIGLGAAGIANSLSFLIASIGMGGLSVVAPLISKAKAEKNIPEINRLFRAGIKVALWFSLILGLVGLLCIYCFEIFQQSPEINTQAPAFMAIIVVSNAFMFVFAATKQLSDGLSRTYVAMIITLFGLLLNLIFNIILINGYWGFPKMGLIGSATSTLITRILMMLALLFYLFQTKAFKKYLHSKYKSLKTNDLVALIFKIGVPSGLQYFFEIAAFSLAVIMMGWLGENQLAAHQIAINVASTTYMMASGLGIAGGIRVGEGRGLKDLSKIRLSGNVALLLVIAFMASMMLLILLFNRFFVELYISDNEVIAIAIDLMFVAAVFQLSDGVQVVSLGILRGISDVNIPTWITMFAYWVLSLPLGYLLAFRFNMDAIGIWIGLLAGLTASAILLTVRFYYLIKKMKVE